MVSAPALGAGGRGFKSRLPDAALASPTHSSPTDPPTRPGDAYQMLPRATVTASPFTPLASSEASHATVLATSSSVTSRPEG